MKSENAQLRLWLVKTKKKKTNYKLFVRNYKENAVEIKLKSVQRGQLAEDERAFGALTTTSCSSDTPPPRID